MTCRACAGTNWIAICAIVWPWPGLPAKPCSAPGRCKLHRVTRGTPRLVNIIAHKALMLAFSEGRQQVFARHIRDAAADTPETRTDWLSWAAALAGAALIVLLGIAWVVRCDECHQPGT